MDFTDKTEFYFKAMIDITTNPPPRLKDSTWVCEVSFCDGNMRRVDHKIYFKHYKKYDDLPGPCKCEEVKKDFEEYWKDQSK